MRSLRVLSRLLAALTIALPAFAGTAENNSGKAAGHNPAASIFSEQRVRRIATDYLVAKHQPAKSDLRIDAVSHAGDDFLVFATISNATTYRLIVNLQTGRVLSDHIIYPVTPQKVGHSP
jgi:hypothetical protein